MMIIFILPLLWNMARGSPALDYIPLFSNAFGTIPSSEDAYDLGFIDFIPRVLTNLANSHRNRDRTRGFGSIDELKKSLDDTIGLLQVIRNQLDEEEEKEAKQDDLISSVKILLTQAFLGPAVGSPINPSPEECDELPVVIEFVSVAPDGELSEINGTETTTSKPVHDEKSTGSPLLNILIKSGYDVKGYPSKKKNSLDKKKKKPDDESKALYRKKLLKRLKEMSNEVSE